MLVELGCSCSFALCAMCYVFVSFLKCMCSFCAHMHAHTHARTHTTQVWMVYLELIQNKLVIDIVSYVMEDFWQRITDEVDKVPEDSVSDSVKDGV